MAQSIAAVTLVVHDYDEAVSFFTEALDFELVADTFIDADKRWVLVAPHNGAGAALLLAKATTAEQQGHIGNQTGGRVFLFLQTGDFWADYQRMKARGVRFTEEPRDEQHGLVVVFLDLYGNRWDLLQRKASAGG